MNWGHAVKKVTAFLLCMLRCLVCFTCEPNVSHINIYYKCTPAVMNTSLDPLPGDPALQLTVKEQALLYTSRCWNKAMHKASHLLTLNLAACVCLCVTVHMCVLFFFSSSFYECSFQHSCKERVLPGVSAEV